MKILAFGGSTSSTSINRQFAMFAAKQVAGAEVTALDLREFDLPIFSVDAQAADGVPEDAVRFLELIESHDGLVVSMAEHNSSYTAAFKNLFDWASRERRDVWAGKPMLLLSTSPGGRGGASVMAAARDRFPRAGADIKATFSLPSFRENFSAEDGITDDELKGEFERALASFVGDGV